MTTTKTTAALAALALTAFLALPATAAPVGGASCGVSPAGQIEAPERLGGYWGMKLPGSFKHLRSQAQVDRAITHMSRTENWTCFQILYGGAVRKWRENTKRR